MLCLRVAALYRDVTVIIWLLWVSFALCHGIRMAFNLNGITILTGKSANTSSVV